MWKDILVFADDTQTAHARVGLALELARAQAAHLEARVVTALPPRPFGAAAGAVEDIYREVRRSVEAGAVAALASLTKLAPIGDTFSAARLDAAFDQIRSEVAALVQTSDLAVVGQAESGDGGVGTEIALGALFSGGRPCLLVPPSIEPLAWGRRALIAWKGTPQAARAVQAALPLLKAADSVRVLFVDRTKSERDGDSAVARLQTHLARHGVRVGAPILAHAGNDNDVGRTIVDEAKSCGADLLVMGAYGHSRLTEFVFGGVSRYMIKHASAPMLMAH